MTTQSPPVTVRSRSAVGVGAALPSGHQSQSNRSGKEMFASAALIRTLPLSYFPFLSRVTAATDPSTSRVGGTVLHTLPSLSLTLIPIQCFLTLHLVTPLPTSLVPTFPNASLVSSAFSLLLELMVSIGRQRTVASSGRSFSVNPD